jgi:hypothetical protein
MAKLIIIFAGVQGKAGEQLRDDRALRAARHLGFGCAVLAAYDERAVSRGFGGTAGLGARDAKVAVAGHNVTVHAVCGRGAAKPNWWS